MKPATIRRRCAPCVAAHAWPSGLHPVLARLFAGRGLSPADALPGRLGDLVAPSRLGGIERACAIIADAIAKCRRICIVGDFDADGATGTAVAVRGLRMLGASDVSFRVPNRARDGYGLSVGVVESLEHIGPDLIVTVDNGIASHAGVAAARRRGIRVIVTDHHLPGALLPDADAIVNPNATGDAFPSKSLAGVGVMFYLLLALRAHLRAARAFEARAEPDLSVLLDLVALGTVADLVPLDINNRILVEAGLRRIRSGRCCAGIAALYRAAGRDPARAASGDLGFVLGPRINAAGRLDDMSLGIACLLSDEPVEADELAARLSTINEGRRGLQSAMIEQAESMTARFLDRHPQNNPPCGVVLYEPDWHPGVVGLVASRLKDRLHRPVVALGPADAGHEVDPLSAPRMQEARAGNGEWRGSARSIAGFHLRDALAEVDARCPGMISRFGGHAMAAGLTISAEHLPRLAAEFDATARARLSLDALEQIVWSDGELDPCDYTAELALALRHAGPWGQAFPEPAFDAEFDVESWRTVGGHHLKLRLRLAGRTDPLDAIMFNAVDNMPPPVRMRAVYQLDLDHWNGRERVQLLVRHIEPA